jgi:acyl-CoA hydrolase
VVGLPLGLGKPNELVNAFYRRARSDPSIELEIVTALSLDPPTGGSDLERRFLEPFVERHFGPDYPRLEYVADLRRGQVPDNVRISQFYLQSGAFLGNPLVQRHYISSNYTHVARDLADRGVNLILQLVAEERVGGETRYSLSSNPDVTLDLAERLRRQPDHDWMMIGQVHPGLPFMHGDAVVGPEFFDEVLPAGAAHRLFAVPREPVSVQDYWVGLHASELVADGGTLQIGIGALSDALVRALILRHRENDAYRALLGRSGAPAGRSGGGRTGGEIGGRDRFASGLYGASELFMDGFMHLYRAGILTREVFDDLETQARADAGRLEETPELVGTGALMDAAFFLGSRPFYEFLNDLDAEERPRFRMTSVGRINQLYGGSEALELLQRRRARFFNTCMMVDVTGGAVSDGLDDHRVVSGVGGQYNFVAMAHAMEDGRSILMLRSTRESGGTTTSNIVWEHPATTIPRHLRDLVVTEYGVADLRGRTDEECIQALIGISDARFQDALASKAKAAGKLDPSWRPPDATRANTPEQLRERLAPEREAGLFPDYPFGSDFTEVEERLVRALARLKRRARSRPALLADALRGRPDAFPREMERMDLERPQGLRERFYARALARALEETDRD